MKPLAAYAISTVGFAAAMSLHAYAEKEPEIRAGKTRAIAASPLWPLYTITALIYLKKSKTERS